MSMALNAESLKRTTRLKPAGRTLRRMTRIALVGPDGVGKSTVIALLRKWFEQEFRDGSFHVRQWRPGLLPDLGCFLGKAPGTGKAVAPRRKPGKMHLARVFYYYWDFLLGSWWKDTVNTPAGALIIYDRCALDMQVDPVRFGLKSTLGTRFLARFTPHPDLVICLEDSPDRIWQRKKDIQQHEMREQLERWRELSARNIVHAIVRVQGGPEHVASSVWQLVVDAAQEQTPQTPASSETTGLESLDKLLGQATGTGSEFLPLPSPSRPRFLVPLGSNRAAAHSLAVYNPQTIAGRAWKSCVSLGLGTGIVQRAFPGKLRLDAHELEGYLAEVTGLSSAAISVSLGTPGVHRKPVFQVMDVAGRVRAFAKAGWNDATNELVQREAGALSSLGHQTFSTATVPELLDARRNRGNYILVMAATAGTAQGPVVMDQRHLQFLVELQALNSTSTSAGANRLQTVATRIPEVHGAGYSYYGQLLEAAIDRCVAVMSRDGMPLGFSHGDFSPWNIRTAGEKLLVLDWEYCVDQVPAAHDLFHFLIGSGIELKHLSGPEMYRRLTSETADRRHVETFLYRTGIDREWSLPLLIAYLAETLSANILRFHDSPSSVDRTARAAWAAMLGLALRSDGAGL